MKNLTLPLLFLLAFVLRSLYGMTLFSGEDSFQVYLIGLKHFATGQWPYWGPDVVYTQSQIAGGLQGLLVSGPLFLLQLPEAPYFLLNVLSLAALAFFGWYLTQRISTLPAWLIWGWLMTAPWTLNFSAHIENPSYVLPAAILFFVSVWEAFPIYEKRLIPLSTAFFCMGFSLCWVMQLHLSWVLMPPFIAAAFFFSARLVSRRLPIHLLYFLLGAATTASTFLPTLLRFGSTSGHGIAQNIRFNSGNLLEVLNIAAKSLSFASFEVLRFMGADTSERLAFLERHLWAAPFTVLLTMVGVAQVLWFCWSFFKNKNASQEWVWVKYFTLAAILLTYVSYWFSDQPPRSHAFYLLLPVMVWYACYCYERLFQNRWFKQAAGAVLLAGLVFHTALALDHFHRYSLWKYRTQVATAIQHQDYTLLGLRRESLLEKSRWGAVWQKNNLADGRTQYTTGFEYPDPAFMPQNILRQQAHSGEFACKSDSLQPFGIQFRNALTELVQHKTVHLSAFLKSDYTGEILVIADIKQNGQTIFWKKQDIRPLISDSRDWQKVELNIELPPALNPDNELLLYLWLPQSGPGTVWTDDVELMLQ